MRQIAVAAAPAQLRDVLVTERSVGQLESLVIPEIAAEVEGRIVQGYVKTGERVVPGQLLAELEVADYQIAAEATRAELGQLEALAANQRRTVARYAKLSANKLISADRYDEAIAQLQALEEQIRAARARLQQSERALTKTRILSPYAGVVDAELISPGISSRSAIRCSASPRSIACARACRCRSCWPARSRWGRRWSSGRRWRPKSGNQHNLRDPPHHRRRQSRHRRVRDLRQPGILAAGR